MYYIFQNLGSRLPEHAKNAEFHPHCNPRCEYQITGKNGRQLTPAEWSLWANDLASIYPRHRNKIPPQYLTPQVQQMTEERQFIEQNVRETEANNPLQQGDGVGDRNEESVYGPPSPSSNPTYDDALDKINPTVIRVAFVEEPSRRASKSDALTSRDFVKIDLSDEDYEVIKEALPGHIYRSGNQTLLQELVSLDTRRECKLAHPA